MHIQPVFLQTSTHWIPARITTYRTFQPNRVFTRHHVPDGDPVGSIFLWKSVIMSGAMTEIWIGIIVWVSLVMKHSVTNLSFQCFSWWYGWRTRYWTCQASVPGTPAKPEHRHLQCPQVTGCSLHILGRKLPTLEVHGSLYKEMTHKVTHAVS